MRLEIEKWLEVQLSRNRCKFKGLEPAVRNYCKVIELPNEWPRGAEAMDLAINACAVYEMNTLANAEERTLEVEI